MGYSRLTPEPLWSSMELLKSSGIPVKFDMDDPGFKME